MTELKSHEIDIWLAKEERLEDGIAGERICNIDYMIKVNELEKACCQKMLRVSFSPYLLHDHEVSMIMTLRFGRVQRKKCILSSLRFFKRDWYC